MSKSKFYIIKVGTKEIERHFKNDNAAIRFTNKWIVLARPSYVESLKDCINSSLYNRELGIITYSAIKTHNVNEFITCEVARIHTGDMGIELYTSPPDAFYRWWIPANNPTHRP